MQIACNDLGKNDERAVNLLEVFARLSDPVISFESVKQIGRIKHPSALSALQRLLDDCREGQFKDTISREIRRLKMSGVPSKDYPYRVKAEHYKSIISTMDGTGSRIIWFSWRHPQKRKLCTLNILINVEEGIRDCWSISEITVRDFNLTIKELKKGAEVIEDYDYGLTLVRDALMINQKEELPCSFCILFLG